MTLPKGTSSGRGREHLGRALPPKADAAPPAPRPRSSLQRKVELRQVSERREAERPRASSTLTTRPRRRPKEGPQTPDAWKADCGLRAGYRCEVSGEELEWDWDAHHVIPKGLLRERGLHHLVWHPSNAMAVQQHIHAAHTSADRDPSKRIPRSALRQHHLDFARLLDATDDGEWASCYLERHYPEYP